MALRFIDTETVWEGELIDGVRHPRDIADKWTLAELAAIGLEPVPPQPAPTPSTDPADYPLTKRQFFTLVNYLDKDAEIRAAIAAIGDAMQRAAALSAYENAGTYERNDPLFASLAPAVGLTETEIDDAWMLAKDSTP